VWCGGYLTVTYSPATDTWSAGPALSVSDLTNRPVARAAISGDGTYSVADNLFVDSQVCPLGVVSLPDIFHSKRSAFFCEPVCILIDAN